MKKYLHILLKVILTFLLLTPLLGLTGIFPLPTRELYNTDIAFAFIEMLTETAYINYIMSAVNVLAIVALWAHREALAALLIAPITVNVVAFHAFLDGGLFTAGAVLGNVLLLLNLYFLWQNRDKYQALLSRG